MKKKIFVVSWHIFPFDVLVCLGVERKDILRRIAITGYKLSEEETEKLTMHGLGRTVMLTGGQTILWTKHYPKGINGTVVHEINHAVYFILNRLGITVTDDCDEIPAYMSAYLAEEILKKL